MTRLNSMTIPTADLRRRLEMPAINRSPKDGFKQGGVAMDGVARQRKRPAFFIGRRPDELSASG
jgi:hypothetical protein